MEMATFCWQKKNTYPNTIFNIPFFLKIKAMFEIYTESLTIMKYMIVCAWTTNTKMIFSSLLEFLIKWPKIYKTYFHLTVHHDSLYFNSRVTKNFSYWAKLSLKSYKTYIIASPKIAKLLQGVFILIRVFVDFLWAFHSFKKFPIGFYIPPIFP